MQGYRDTGIQGYRITGYKNVERRYSDGGYNNMGIQKYGDIEIFGYILKGYLVH